MLDPRIMTVVRRAAGDPASTAPDAVLVESFIRSRDEIAFTELVARHGPAVWALCRRLLRSEADADDAFQATFLVLARRAGQVRKSASVGSWLHGVAFRLSRKLQKRRPLDPARLSRRDPPPDPADNLTWAEVRTALDEELAQLPDQLRAPLILCYLRGLTQDEAAAELGWKPRTLKARIARGRSQLRRRLIRRGVELPAALAGPLLASDLTAAVPARLVSRLPGAAVNFANQLSPGDGVTTSAATLARTGIHAMSVRTAILAVSAVALVTAGTVFGLGGGVPRPTAPTAPASGNAAPVDALPQGAIARIGTTQMRAMSWHKRAFFSADGKTIIATVPDAHMVTWWDPLTGRRLQELEVPNARFDDAAFDPASGLLAIMGPEFPATQPIMARQIVAMIWLIDTKNRTVVRNMPIKDVQHAVYHLIRFTPDGKRVVAATDADLRVFDVATGDELIRTKIRAQNKALAVSPDGKTIAFGAFDVFFWHWHEGEEPKKFFDVGRFGSELIVFSTDGKLLYVQPLAGGPMRVVDVATGRQTGTLDVDGGKARTAAFSPDGKTLAVGYFATSSGSSREYTVTLWDVATGKEVKAIPLGGLTAEQLCWSMDGKRLTAVSDARLWAWDAATGQPLSPETPGHAGQTEAVAFAPDGTLFTANSDYTIRSWDADTGRANLTLLHDNWVYGMAVSPDGSLVAGSALRNDLRVWDAKTGATRFKLLGNGRMGGSRNLQFTPDGSRLIAFGHDDDMLRIYDMRTGKLLAENHVGEKTTDDSDDRMARMERAFTVASEISKDGSALVVLSGKTLRIYDTMTAKERSAVEVGQAGSIPMLTLSPDGKRVAIAQKIQATPVKMPDGSTQHKSQDVYTVSLWQLDNGKKLWDAQGLGWSPGSISFTPDGKQVASTGFPRGGANKTQFWDAVTGAETGAIDLPLVGTHLAFDRTGKRLAVAMRDTTILVFNVDKALAPAAAK